MFWKTLKYPDGYGSGLLFDWASGHSVDIYADGVGLQRKRYCGIFRESDQSLKQRIVNLECEKRGLTICQSQKNV